MGALYLCTEAKVTLDSTSKEIPDLTDASFECNKEKAVFDANICDGTPNGKVWRALSYEYTISVTTRDVSKLADAINSWRTARPAVELMHSDPDAGKSVTVTVTNTSLDNTSTRASISNPTSLELKFTSSSDSVVTVTAT